jgi:hypothetical protein
VPANYSCEEYVSSQNSQLAAILQQVRRGPFSEMRNAMETKEKVEPRARVELATCRLRIEPIYSISFVFSGWFLAPTGVIRAWSATKLATQFATWISRIKRLTRTCWDESEAVSGKESTGFGQQVFESTHQHEHPCKDGQPGAHTLATNAVGGP